jgi:hypothetical protein
MGLISTEFIGNTIPFEAVRDYSLPVKKLKLAYLVLIGCGYELIA